MSRLSPTLTSLQQSPTVALADRVRKLRAAGRDVIALQTGDPDFPTPQPIVDAAVEALTDGLTHYCDSRGLPYLREAIADRTERLHGVRYDPSTEVLVTCGGIHAYCCGLSAILSPGDEVLVPDPAWMSHVNVVKLLNGVAVRVPGSQENNFWPTLSAWEQALTPRTSALVINSPNNPTGMVAHRDYLRRVAEFASNHGVYIFSDEVYENILYDGHRHTCAGSIPGAKPHTIVINSLSKTYAMTGWRVGYLMAPADVIDQAIKASQHSITNLPPFVQHAAAFALRDTNVQEMCREMVAAYARRRASGMELELERDFHRVRLVEPEGAFYVLVDVRDLGCPSTELADRLLQDTGVAVVPGSAFGDCCEGYLRVTTAASDSSVERGVGMLLDWANGIATKIR